MPQETSKVSEKNSSDQRLDDASTRVHLPIPGEVSFPFQGLYKPPVNGHEEETMRAYLQQLRQELGSRLIERVFVTPESAPQSGGCAFLDDVSWIKLSPKPISVLNNFRHFHIECSLWLVAELMDRCPDSGAHVVVGSPRSAIRYDSIMR
uniref:Uncharacterized protein n=1 Tax=Ditylenchus dipsaci TaxID=166011 RepID=A0A915DH15_9BILA